MEIERKVFEAEVKEFDSKDLTVVHFISTEKQDRGRDILYAGKNDRGKGMIMEGRPVVLLQHGWSDDRGSEPIAKPIWIKPGDFKNRRGVQAKTQFFPDDLGKRLWQKTVEGYMPNWSVGWRPIEGKVEMKTDKSGAEIRHVYEWELLEYSLVAVPMQPDAQTLSGMDHDELCFKFLPESEDRFGEMVGWKKDDGTWEEKPYPNEHSCRLESPEKYVRIRRQNDKFGKGIHAIWGIQKGDKPVELQAIRFDKTKFTPAESRKWVKDNKYKCILFEPASEKCEKCGKDMTIVWDQDVSGDKCGLTCEVGFEYEHVCGDLENIPKCAVCGLLYLMMPEKDGVKTYTFKKQCDCDEEKGAIPYKKTPLAPEGDKWDAGAEVKKAEVKDLKIMCAWLDSEKPDDKGSYKLPHHKADGDHACVWNGVRAAAAACMGARGGANIPEADMGKVKIHLGKHYVDFDKGKPPWESGKGATFDEMVKELLKYGNLDTSEDQAFLYRFRQYAKEAIPDLAEFFEPEKKEADPGSDISKVLTAIDTLNGSLSDLSLKIDAVEEKLNVRIDSLSVKPGEKENQDNPPEIEKITVVNSQEDEKRLLDKIAKDLSSQLTEVVSRSISEAKKIAKEEIDRVRGRVN